MGDGETFYCCAESERPPIDRWSISCADWLTPYILRPVVERIGAAGKDRSRSRTKLYPAAVPGTVFRFTGRLSLDPIVLPSLPRAARDSGITVFDRSTPPVGLGGTLPPPRNRP